MTGRSAPLLRSPPFPWVKPDRAAVSHLQSDARETLPPARIEALLATIREARVGGTFWAQPVHVDPGTMIVRAESAAAARRLLSNAPRRGSPIVLIGPPDAKDWQVDADRIIIDPVDPWSLLRPGITVLADAADEWRLIAAIAGADLVGAPPAPAALADALLGGVTYRDPFTREATSPEATIALLAQWRDWIDRNRGIAVASGMAWWKKARIAAFLWDGSARALPFLDDASEALDTAAKAGGGLAVWPSRVTPDLLDRATAADVPIARVEDGFVRSIGLGADLLPPFSIVVDKGGIYYDPRSGSDLERLLATAEIGPALIQRGEQLAATMVAKGISKYGQVSDLRTGAPRTRRTVLVAGQVEDDLSVRAGGAGVGGNLDLLRRARALEPDAHLIFKPHPDVDAGHRVGRIEDREALTLADEIIRNEPIQSLLGRVDAVHVLTSLVGFEALLRRLETHIHGQPFYAGWGLTHDHAPSLEARSRRRTLGELVAATLILYPRYQDPVTGLPCPPETLLARFAAGWKPRPSLIVFARRLQGRLFKLFGRATS